MATLSQMCVLPEGWGTPSTEQIGKSKRSEWLIAKRKQHDRLMAYRERERIRMERRGASGESLSSSRRRVQRETMADAMPTLESGRKMFAMGKGQPQPKKAKNSVSREQAGTIGRTIVVKRFEGSRLTCVCKSRIY